MSAVVVGLCALALFGVATGLAQGGKVQPRLVLMSRTPVTVAGSHFAPRERVKVQFGAALRVVRSSASGAFVVRFAQSSDPCNDSVIVTARGATGDAAAAKASARACPPAP
jgi:hypothetical protein